MRHRLILAGLAAASLGCGDLFGPGPFAGTYVLETVGGKPVPLAGVNAYVTGSIRVTAFGMAERRIRYRVDSAGTTREFVAAGTCRLHGTRLDLALREGDYVWRPDAELTGRVITLRYPDALDGPAIVEVYRLR